MNDYLNSKRRRDNRNTSRHEYNCGGYALNTFSWYYPSNCSTFDEAENYWAEREDNLLLAAEDFGTEYALHHYVLLDAYEMIKSFNGKLRRIFCVNEARKNERIVAYRIGCDIDNWTTDFHFIFKDYGEKKWHHKMGDKNIDRNRFTDEEVLCKIWDCGYLDYDSEIILLALSL